jgi:A/G-specific adenine glycosylase
MLQQTRVAAVIPYYERFLEAFPDLNTLAGAPAERVLLHWAGLGYYSRARNLQRAAKLIVADYDGNFPREHNAALALPGIGQYTAAAVLSIAFDARHAVLDGNVARVLARIGALRGDLRAPFTWKNLTAAAQELLALKVSGDWNQAMMELGATVCTPKSPRCQDCPVKSWCRARKLGLTEVLPEVRKKPATVDVTLSAAVLLDPRRRTLLVRQPDVRGALFSRMWQFPAVEKTTANGGGELSVYLRENFGLPVNGKLIPLATARHTVTFRKIRVETYLVLVDRLPRKSLGRVVALDRIRQLPISNATKKIAEVAAAYTPE